MSQAYSRQPPPTLRKIWLSQRMVNSLSGLGAREAPAWQGVEIVADPFLPNNWSLHEYSDGSIEVVQWRAV